MQAKHTIFVHTCINTCTLYIFSTPKVTRPHQRSVITMPHSRELQYVKNTVLHFSMYNSETLQTQYITH